MLSTLDNMNGAETQPARLLTVAGICRCVGADYAQVTRALTDAKVEPELTIDDKPLFGRDAVRVVREYIGGGK